MSTRFYVDETKAKAYLLAVASGTDEQLRISRKEIGNLVLPGQRSLHMKDESDSRKRQIADTICHLRDFGVDAVIYDAGRAGTERERRARCLRALVEDAAQHRSAHLVLDHDETIVSWDRQQLIELIRDRGVKGRVEYSHLTRHEEGLLAIPDAIAWCWARGGDWRRRITPLVTEVRKV